MDHAEPTTMTGGKFSTPYVLARYLRDGSVDLDHFTDEALADETVLGLASLVELTEDDSYEAAFPDLWGASVEVKLADDTILTGERDYPRGDYRDPIPAAEYRDRNRKLLAYGLSESRVTDALDALETVADQPVRTTTAALTQ
jgi:2-methylcitrate dehydratase PrpD